MELSIVLAKQIFAMILLMVVGYIFIKTKILKEEDSKVLSKVTMYAACPCIIVDAFMEDYTPAQGTGLVIGFICAMLAHLVMILLSNAAEKLFRLEKIEKVSLWSTNAGYILIPLVSAALGKEYVFYCTAFIAAQTIFFWTYLQIDLGQRQQVSLKKVALNPNLIAIVIGVVIFYGQIRLPVILSSAVTNMGNATGALSMLVVGMAIGKEDLLKIFTYKRAYFVCFGRLIIYPLIVIALIFLTRITAVSPVAQRVLLCTVLASAAPVATIITQFAEIYDLDGRSAGSINVMSVLLCIFTMPVMIWIYQMVC